MKKGFTLVEVMIAVAILGIALVPMMNMLGMGTRGFVKTQNTIKAYNLAVEGLEWMKSLDFLEYYYKKYKDKESVFTIYAHYSYSINPDEYSSEYKSDYFYKDPQPIMFVYNQNEVDNAEDDPDDKKMLPSFYGYYSYRDSPSSPVRYRQVSVSYDGKYKEKHFKAEGLNDFKRYGYFKVIDENTALLTCVVYWKEEAFVTGNNERRESVQTVVVNNANVKN